MEEDDVEIPLMYILTLLGGLRPSELRGLIWSKINIPKMEMVIDQTLLRTKTQGDIVKGTKNNTSRTIQLIPLAITLIKAHKENELAKKRRLKIRKDIETLNVFTDQNGNPVSDNYFRKEWKKICEKYGFEYKSPYSLRHSAATLLAYHNVPKASISSQLGHLNSKTTDVYIHAVEESEKEINDIMTKTLQPKNKLFIVS